MFFDLETTGTNPSTDRIVEISLIKVMPDGREMEHSHRINPGIPIPASSTAIHHITDADVANEPKFSDIAAKLNKWLEGCDMAGYNSNKFDVPLLMEEFKRAGIPFDTSGRRFVDTHATYEVLMSQLDRYEDLQNDVEKLSKIGQKRTLDLAGRIAEDENGNPVFNFGKYKGQKVEDVFKRDIGYYSWMMQGEFPQNTKDVITRLRYKFRKK